MTELQKLSNVELLDATDVAVAKEKAAVTLTTRHFQEVYRRRAYLPAYASMFEMLTIKYGYCAGSASIRIKALKLIDQVPAVQEKIEAGELSMTAAASIQSFLYTEKKAERAYSQNAKIELVEACLHKSTREVQKEFVRRNPELEKRDVVRSTSEDRARLEVSLSHAALEKLNQLKDLLSHSEPTLGEVIARLAEDGLEKYCPRRKAARSQARKASRSMGREKDGYGSKIETAFKNSVSTGSAGELASESESPLHAHEVEAVRPAEAGREAEFRSRYITARERHAVHNDGEGCSFIDVKSGRRCGSQSFLQLDHVIPFADGGAHRSENLRWICGAHNRWRATAH